MIVQPFRVIDYIHDSIIDITAYFSGKLNEYNEVMLGKSLAEPDDPLNIEKEHIDFIERVKKEGKYEKLLEFAKIYKDVPYNMRAGYLTRFFNLY